MEIIRAVDREASEAIPREVTSEHRQTRARKMEPYAEAAAAPASPKAVAVGLDKLLAFAQAFNLPAAQLEAAAGIYREALGELRSGGFS